MARTSKYLRNDIVNSEQFAKEHTNHTEKCFKVNSIYIWCIQRKYDDTYKKTFTDVKDEYGIQVWTQNDRDIFKGAECLKNEFFNNPEEANKRFKEIVNNYK